MCISQHNAEVSYLRGSLNTVSGANVDRMGVVYEGIADLQRYVDLVLKCYSFWSMSHTQQLEEVDTQCRASAWRERERRMEG